MESLELDIPVQILQALDVARSLLALTDVTKITPADCDYASVSALSKAAGKSDKTYIVSTAVKLMADDYYKDRS